MSQPQSSSSVPGSGYRLMVLVKMIPDAEIRWWVE